MSTFIDRRHFMIDDWVLDRAVNLELLSDGYLKDGRNLLWVYWRATILLGSRLIHDPDGRQEAGTFQ